MNWYISSPLTEKASDADVIRAAGESEKLPKMALQAASYGASPTDVELRWVFDGKLPRAEKEAILQSVLQAIRAEFSRIASD